MGLPAGTRRRGLAGVRSDRQHMTMEVFDVPATPTTEPTPERLMQFTFGFAPPLIIEAAIRHRVFDLLDEGAETIDQLCAQTRTSARGLRALLNALVGLELLRSEEH